MHSMKGGAQTALIGWTIHLKVSMYLFYLNLSVLKIDKVELNGILPISVVISFKVLFQIHNFVCLSIQTFLDTNVSKGLKRFDYENNMKLLQISNSFIKSG